METMSYYSELVVTLQDIDKIARDLKYDTNWLSQVHFGHIRLNIHYGPDKYNWWQWYELELDEIWFDSLDEKNRVISLDSSSTLLFEYYSTSFNEMARFMKLIMSQYGGWLDCKGDALNLISIDMLDNLTDMCP